MVGRSKDIGPRVTEAERLPHREQGMIKRFDGFARTSSLTQRTCQKSKYSKNKTKATPASIVSCFLQCGTKTWLKVRITGDN